jgi:hypothetical protein
LLNHVDVAELLIREGADVNFSDEVTQTHPPRP